MAEFLLRESALRKNKIKTYTNHIWKGLVSGYPDAKMMWTLEERGNTQKIIYKYGVCLAGWPEKKHRLRSPGQFSSNDQLLELIEGFKSGRIAFKRVSRARVAALERRHGLSGDPACRGRRDAGKRAPLRPPATRSKRLRKSRIATPKFVPEGADAAEIDWDQWMATYQAGLGCAEAH